VQNGATFRQVIDREYQAFWDDLDAIIESRSYLSQGEVNARDSLTRYLAEIGRKGGQAKVPKGAAMLTPEERRERGRKGMAARWGKKKPATKKGKAR
jgi:hypothetical protein